MQKIAVYSDSTELVDIDKKSFDENAFFVHTDSESDQIVEIENGTSFLAYASKKRFSTSETISFLQQTIDFCFHRTFSIKQAHMIKNVSPLLAFVNDWFCASDREKEINLIYSGVEMYMIIKLCFFYFWHAKVNYQSNHKHNQHFSMLFNLPPGLGKTWQNTILGAEFSPKICCPTAKAAFLYPPKLGTNTIHSGFKIMPRFAQHRNNTKNSNIAMPMSSFYIFDECYMIGENILNEAIKKILNTSFFLFTGDSAQMPPVAARMVNFDLTFPMRNIKFCLDYNPSPYLIIPRFADSMDLQTFILRLKAFIDNPNETFELTSEYIEKWFEYLSLFTVQKEKIETKNLVRELIQQQNIQNKLIAEKRYDELIVSNIIVGYFNNYSRNIITKVFKEADFSLVDIPERYGVSTQSQVETIKQNLSGVIMSRSMFSEMQHNFAFKARVNKFLAQLPGTILSDSNKLCTGAYIMCRKNMTLSNGDKIYNGQTGYIISQKWDQPVAVPILNGEYAVTNQDLEKLCTRIVFQVYLIEQHKIINVSYSLINVCQNCAEKTCIHSTETGHAEQFTIAVCFWHVNYALTIYNLQGVTLSNVRVLFEPSQLFKRHLLKTAYTLLSRARKPGQIVVDKDFFMILIQKLCSPNQPLTMVKKKLIEARILGLCSNFLF